MKLLQCSHELDIRLHVHRFAEIQHCTQYVIGERQENEDNAVDTGDKKEKSAFTLLAVIKLP